MKNRKKLISTAAVIILLLLIVARFILYFFKSDGFSGLSMLLPALLLLVLLTAVCMSASFAAWVYQDCRKRGDDPILWAVVVFAATPFIGLLVYFLRRPEPRRACPACGHQISLRAKYCEECGTYIEDKEVYKTMNEKRTHHLKYLISGTICMILMLACLTGFIVTAASGYGINTDATADKRVWNTGIITMNSNSYLNGVWKLDFRHASDGFTAEEKMVIHDPKTEVLYADISCGTVPENSSLTLWLVQDETVRSMDVTDLSQPLEYSLSDFSEGKIYVRLQINGVEDTVSEIYIE